MKDSDGDNSNIAEVIKTMILGEHDLAKFREDNSVQEPIPFADIITELNILDA